MENDKKISKLDKLNELTHNAIKGIGSVPSLIIHTIFFVGSFSLILLGVETNKVLLVVTTLVSLEAIYLAIFIQMAVNLTSESLKVVEVNIDEIQKDVDEIQEDVDEIQEDVEEIQKDVDEKDESENHSLQNKIVIKKIESQLRILIDEIKKIKEDK